LQPEVVSGLLHDVYMMRSSRQSVATATVTAALMRPQFHPVSHEIKTFNWCDRPCDCCTERRV